MLVLLFFFFKQKTAYEMRISDWSSDVCSSDLLVLHELKGTCGGRIGACRDDDGIGARRARREQFLKIGRADVMADIAAKADVGDRLKGSADFPGLDRTGCRIVGEAAGRVQVQPLDHRRSEERRVGTGCVSSCSSGW